MRTSMKKEIYRHYGSSEFDINKFVPIYNRYLSNKPCGGLWACPTKDVDIGWDTWCKNEGFRLEHLKEYFDFKINEKAKILTIRNIKDLKKLPRIVNKEIEEFISRDTMNLDIDFDALKKKYDGMMVWMYRSRDIDKELMCCDGMYYKLYGWDVDTLLIFNPNIIEVV